MAEVDRETVSVSETHISEKVFSEDLVREIKYEAGPETEAPSVSDTGLVVSGNAETPAPEPEPEHPQNERVSVGRPQDEKNGRVTSSGDKDRENGNVTTKTADTENSKVTSGKNMEPGKATALDRFRGKKDGPNEKVSTGDKPARLKGTDKKEEKDVPETQEADKVFSGNVPVSGEAKKAEAAEAGKAAVGGAATVHGKKAAAGTGEKVTAAPNIKTEKVKVHVPSENEKVHTLNILRGKSEKVTTERIIPGKVSTGDTNEIKETRERPSRLEELRSREEDPRETPYTIAGEAETVEKEQVKEKKKKVRAAGTAASTLLSLLIPGCIIVAILLLFLLIEKWYIPVFTIALKEGYDEAVAEETGRYDYGSDQITYLITKYGLSEKDLIGYDFPQDTIFVGGRELAPLEENSALTEAASKLHVLSSREARLGSDAAAGLMLDSVSLYDKLKKGGSPRPCVIFWFGQAEMADGGYRKDPQDFAEAYEEMILGCSFAEEKEANAGDGISALSGNPYIYVLSLLDTDPKAADDDKPTRIGRYNEALREMCAEHRDWCYADIGAFLDEETFESDGKTFSAEFFRFKLLPFMAKSMGGRYHFGRHVDDYGGLYRLSPDVSLLDMVKYLYSYKNGNGLYDEFKNYSKMDRASFTNKEVQSAFRDAWDRVYWEEESIHTIKQYADQQEFIAEEYYKNRIRTAIESKYDINIKGSSYAFKSAVTSLGFTFAYPDGESFEKNTASDAFYALFDGVDWAGAEDGIITKLYDNAIRNDPGRKERWEAEKQDALAMYHGTLDIYAADVNEYGYVNWQDHLHDGEKPEDVTMYTDANPSGIQKVVHYNENYVADHDETGGPTAEAYTAYALSFADPPEMYRKGNYKLPYILGGANLEVGADCSGFVGAILAKYGYLDPNMASVHAYSSWHFPNLGTGVPMEDIRVGDVVCYWKNGLDSPGHVAIYIGNGLIVHEPNTGRGVEIGDVYIGGSKPIVAIRRFDLDAP